MIADMVHIKKAIRQILHDQQIIHFKKTKKSKLNVKAMLVVSFEIKGVIMAKWAPLGQAVN